MPHRCQSVIRLLVVFVLLVCASLLAPASASAHAELTGTVPANGQLVADAPTTIKLTFSESVTVAFGGIKVFDPDGDLVDIDRPETRSGTVIVPIDASTDGTYAVSWRAISADGHPVRGAFTYDVGEHRGEMAMTRATQASETSRAQEIAYGVARAVTLLGLLGAVGAAVFAVAVVSGWRPVLVRSMLGLVLVGTLAGYVLDAALAGGFSIAQALHWGVLREQAGTVYGTAGLVRLGAALVCLGLVSQLTARLRWVALAAFLVLGSSQSLAGHAVATDPVWLRLPLDMLHTLAAAIWLGGLVQLRSAVLGRAASREQVERYSTVALVSVLVLLATGLYAAFTEIGLSAEALLDTTYGRLVLGKTALFAVLVAIGAVNRRSIVPALAQSWPEAAARLRRFVAIELGVLLGVIALTAWLIGAVPARNQLQPELIDMTVKLRQRGTLQVLIDPATAGTNAVHLYANDSSGQLDGSILSLDLEADNRTLGIEHLPIQLLPAGPGHFTSDTVTIPYPGTWRFQASIKRGKFDEELVHFTARIQRSDP